MHFDRHMRGRRMGKLKSIVVTSTVGIERRQFGAAQVTGSAKTPLMGA
jgi:hypothetical protein